MISQIKQKGFTIVELLIVIVVIAILAAISMAAYTSITARANDSTAAASAKAVKDVASTYNGNYGKFPTTKAQFTNGKPGDAGEDPAVAKLPSDVYFASAQYGTNGTTANTAAQALTDDSTNGKAAKKVLVYPCGTTGFRIFYKNFTSGSTTVANSVDVGDCSTAPTSTTNSIANS